MRESARKRKGLSRGRPDCDPVDRPGTHAGGRLRARELAYCRETAGPAEARPGPCPPPREVPVSTSAATFFSIPPSLRAAARAARTLVLALAALGCAAALAPGAKAAGLPAAAGARAAAPSAGSGGWFWPVGSEEFGGYAGFLAPRGGNVHVAQDMHAKKGSPVYAVGDGTVWISRADTGGYGVGGRPGGCIIIVHRTGAGEEFRALYGHLLKLTVKEGDRVVPGQQIAVVNGLDHLHFGIHPSDEYRDRNPYAGEVPKKWKDHGGWVDPVAYLRAHPRGASYDPPALPVVRIQTGAAPAAFGAAAGAAYWTETTGTAPGTFAQDLGDGTRRQLAAGETPPPFDSVRYAVNLLAAPAVGFAVRDRLPVLTLAAADAEPAWGAAAALGGSLTNGAGKPFVLADVRLERKATGGWTTVATHHTAAAGDFTFTYTPRTATRLRVRFLLPEKQPAGAVYVAPAPAPLTVTPRVQLGVPAAPAQLRVGAPASFAGSLLPRHQAGPGGVSLEFQRLKEGAWAAGKTVKATVADAALGSVYVATVKLSAAGRWRVRAVHPADEVHAETASGWRDFVVK